MAQVAPTFDNFTGQLSGIPEGKEGVKATLKAMARLIKAGKSNPQMIVFARRLTQHLKPKDYVGEARVIHAFVRDKIRYIRDPRGLETIVQPDKLLQIQSGDCDDKSVLVATLLEAAGHKTRLVAVGSFPEKFSHVYVETLLGNKWIPVETTEPWPLGKGPSNVQARLQFHY